MLIIGYGNPGRRDDGLGPALAEIMEAKRLRGVAVDAVLDASQPVVEPADDHTVDVHLRLRTEINGALLPEPDARMIPRTDDQLGLLARTRRSSCPLHR